MQFGFLGPLEVHGEDGAITIGSRLQRRLLAVLLVHAGSVVPADRLVDLLWGDRPPADARQALWSCVARLRRGLADQAGVPVDELLATRPPGYVLAARADQIDAAQFAHLVSVASQIAANRPDEAADLLDRALGLWRGPALQEFVDEPFAMVEAARLDEMRLAALEERFEIDLARGEHTALVAPLGAFTADHPMRERARSQLMLALHRSSRQPEALECYRDYRELLNAELGLEPSAALRALETQILQQAPELDWQGLPPTEARTREARADPEAAVGTGPRLPAELTSFVGRTSDVGAIIAALGRGAAGHRHRPGRHREDAARPAGQRPWRRAGSSMGSSGASWPRSQTQRPWQRPWRPRSAYEARRTQRGRLGRHVPRRQGGAVGPGQL